MPCTSSSLIISQSNTAYGSCLCTLARWGWVITRHLFLKTLQSRPLSSSTLPQPHKPLIEYDNSPKVHNEIPHPPHHRPPPPPQHRQGSEDQQLPALPKSRPETRPRFQHQPHSGCSCDPRNRDRQLQPNLSPRHRGNLLWEMERGRFGDHCCNPPSLSGIIPTPRWKLMGK